MLFDIWNHEDLQQLVEKYPKDFENTLVYKSLISEYAAKQHLCGMCHNGIRSTIFFAKQREELQQSHIWTTLAKAVLVLGCIWRNWKDMRIQIKSHLAHEESQICPIQKQSATTKQQPSDAKKSSPQVTREFALAKAEMTSLHCIFHIRQKTLDWRHCLEDFDKGTFQWFQLL